MFSEQTTQQLYDILQVKSSDVGFLFNTEMLMLDIISAFEQAEDAGAFEQAIRYHKGGNLLWERISAHYNQVNVLLKG